MHSIFSPSAAHRWLRCPASLAETLALPDKERESSSTYADEGTACHTAVEERDVLGETTVKFTKDWQEPAVVEAEKQRNKLLKEYGIKDGDKYLTEELVNLNAYGMKEVFGTADVVAYSEENKTLVIVDYKFGAGVRVSPKENPQLMIYALGALARFQDVDKIVLAIIQPRIYDKALTWETNRDTLEEWLTAVLLPGYKLAKVGVENPKEAVYQPSEEACRWCPASKGHCQAVTQNALDMLDSIKDLIKKEPDSIDVSELGRILSKKKEILNQLKKLEARAIKLAKQGQKIPGMKLVKSIGHTTWTVPAGQVEKFLRGRRVKKAECWKMKIVSPKEAKQLLNARDKLSQANLRWIEEHTERPERGLVIVPESDPRPEAIDALTELSIEELI